MERPPVRGMLEYGLYVEDLERALGFYRRAFGFPCLFSNDRMAALDVERRDVLLLFTQGASAEPSETPGGTLPGHDAAGEQHIAFAIDHRDLDAWRAWLRELEIAIEGEVGWDRGGHSLYFRDPDGHLLELVTPHTWETY